MDLASLILHLVGLMACLVASAFFSASETALMSLPRSRIFKLSETGRTGLLIRQAVSRPDRLLGAILLGNNLANVVGTAVGTALALRFWPDHGLIIASAALTVIFLIFGEITPKTLAVFGSQTVSQVVIHPLTWFMSLTRPAVYAFSLISRACLALAGQSAEKRRLFTREDFVSLVLSGRREGYLSSHEQEMLQSVLDLNRITLGEVMQPINRVKSLDVSLGLKEAVAQAVTGSFSRYPVTDKNGDKVLGYVHLRDLIRSPQKASLKDLVHPPVYVPESRTVQDQLMDFRLKQNHLAFVVDEIGQVVGLVTLEDVLEEIVGEILDEYDTRTALLKPLEGGGFSASGRMTVREAGRLTGLPLPEGPYHTLSGLVQTLAQKIPAAGETYAWQNLRFKVERMDGRAVGRVTIREENNADDEPRPKAGEIG